MRTSVLKIGSKGVIKKKVRRDENEFTTRIENIDGDIIRVLTPLYKSILIRLHPGTRVEVSVFDSLNLYQFEAEAINTVIEDNIYYTDMKIVSEITKLERRNYFRVEAMKDVLLRKKAEGDMHDTEEDYAKGITVDLSGGGLQLITAEVFSQSCIVEMRLELDDEELKLDGEVLNRIYQEDLLSYRYMIKFVNLDKFTQEMIVKFVFKLQREKIQKQR